MFYCGTKLYTRHAMPKIPKKHYKLTKKKVIASIKKQRGILSYVARECAVDRGSIYNFLQHYPEIWDVVKEARETVTDEVENEMLNVIFSQDPAFANQKARLIQFYLQNQAKDRGYNAEKEEKKDIGPIVIEMKNIPRPDDA